MMDLFTECLIKRRKQFKEYVVIFPLITLGFAATLAYLRFLSGGMLSGIGFAAVVVMWWGIYIAISNRNIELEYTVTNSDVDIDIIMSKRSRKRLVSFSIKDIEIIAPVENLGDEVFDKVIDASAHDARYDVYYISVVIGGAKTKILINPTEKILNIFEQIRPDRVVRGEE